MIADFVITCLLSLNCQADTLRYLAAGFCLINYRAAVEIHKDRND